MSATLNLTEIDVLAALRAFLLDVTGLADEKVVRGQMNRVPPPAGVDYCVMWPTLRRRLATNTVTPTASGALLDGEAIKTPTEISVQVDFHGPNSANLAQMVSTLMRADYACRFFAAANPAVQPLHADDPRQITFENGEKQVEERWVIGVTLQANPVTSTVQQFADAVTVGLIEVDTTYPPGAP